MVTTGTTNFPTSLDSHSGGDPFGFAAVGPYKTQTTGAISTTDTTITVADNTGFPTRGFLAIGLGSDYYEVVSYTGLSGSTGFTGVTRATCDTTAKSHISGSVVASVPVSRNHNDLAAAIVAVETSLIKRRHAEMIVNGNHDHWQRGTSARTSTTTYSTDTSFAADRMFALPAGASITQQRSTTVPDSRSQYSNLLTGATSVTTVDYGQRIRAGIVNSHALQSLLFTAYIRNDSGGAFTPNLRIGTPSAADNFTTVTNRLDQALQSCADASWTRVYALFDPSAYTNVANGIEALLRIPSGSLNSGAKSVKIAQFSLKPASSLEVFVPPDPDLELARCLQYYQVFGPDAGNQLALAAGYAFSTTLALLALPYRSVMRGVPTVAISNVSHFSLPPSGATITSFAAQAANHGARLDVTASGGGLTAGNAYNLQMGSASAYLELRAEL